ncbi:MAG: universal stress protein [Planctomycetota bacterium]
MLLTGVKKGVVFPFDFSDLSIEGLRRTIDMVEDPLLVQVVFVSDYPSGNDYEGIWGTNEPDSIIRNHLAAFKKTLKEASGFPDLELNVLFGSPSAQIARFASKNDAILIVMPSHGRSGFSRFVLGSVAERVLRLAECPVLILKDLVQSEEPTTSGH